MTRAQQAGTASRPVGLTLLGATGSIGKSTLDVVARHPERLRVFALTAHRSADAMLQLCARFSPRYAVLSGALESAALRRRFAAEANGTELLFGAAALVQVCADPGCSVVMAAIVGAVGLAPAISAARAGKRVLLANKEALVMAGPFFMRAVQDNGATLLPIDSEHNAVFQCLPQVTPDEACAHPNWVMGRKISVDSATMMNKGLEVIEARWLFGLPPERIEVLIHPQSIVHSLVEHVDGSVIAQLSNPDMRVPIAHALGFPERIDSGAAPLELAAIGQLSFERPDPARFPCLGLAYAALRSGGAAPAVLNAANEVAVEAFLAGGLRYTDIPRVIERALQRSQGLAAGDLESVLEADRSARRWAAEAVAERIGRAA